VPKDVENALSTVAQPPRGSRVIRTWIGTSRAENGKTRVTLVWEPVPKVAGERESARRETPARVAVTAVGPDGAPYFRGRVPDAAMASNAPPAGPAGAPANATPQRVTFDAKPGKMQLRLSVEGASEQVLDSEVREVTVPDLTAPQTLIGTPEVFKSRTLRDFQQLKGDAAAVPTAVREFARTDRVLLRVPVYGPGSAAPTLSIHMLNRGGQSMAELSAAPAPGDGKESQIEVPLSGLAPGEYIVEIKAAGDGGDAKELVGFRVTG
jgi:hypothetical protein